MNWKPDQWEDLAASNPDIFLKELQGLNAPNASLFTSTYLECAVGGFRGLSKYKNVDYDTLFFETMALRMPHVNAKPPSNMQLDRVRYMDAKCSPIEHLLWLDALEEGLKPSERLHCHRWLLALRKSKYDDKSTTFSLKNAPPWAAAYARIQQGQTYVVELGQWLESSPVKDTLEFLNAACSLHMDEKPTWLIYGLNIVLSRAQDLYSSLRISDVTQAIASAWKMPSPALDASIEYLIINQPIGMSLMTYSWLGPFTENPYQPMLNWWSRLSAEAKGSIVHRWLNRSEERRVGKEC